MEIITVRLYIPIKKYFVIVIVHYTKFLLLDISLKNAMINFPVTFNKGNSPVWGLVCSHKFNFGTIVGHEWRKVYYF